MNKIQKIFIGAVMLVSLGSVIEAKAEVRNVMFHIDRSVVGGTILGQNVIVENVFDAVPSYGGIQDWRPYASRILRVNRGTEVTIAGVVKYRTVLGKVSMMEFSRRIKIPANAVSVVIK